jgi:hypothetical protein
LLKAAAEHDGEVRVKAIIEEQDVAENRPGRAAPSTRS